MMNDEIYNTTKSIDMTQTLISFTVVWRDNNKLTEPFLFTYKHMHIES